MRHINAVLAHSDPTAAKAMIDTLRPHFRRLVTVNSFEDAEAAIPRIRAGFVIADLELLSSEQIRSLIEHFPGTVFACVHRLADEAMWAEALSVGAVDCCLPSDVGGLLSARDRHVTSMSAAA